MPRPHLNIALCLTGLIAILPLQGLAQPLPPTTIPRAVPSIPPLPPTPSSTPLEIKPTPFSVPELQGDQVVTLHHVQFRGNRTLTPAELDAIVSPYLGQSLTLQQLLEIRTAVTQAYIRKGYTLSSALITISDNPSFNPKHADIVVRCLEAQIDTIKIQGTKRLQGWIREQLGPALSPISETKLAQALYSLHEQPVLRDIRATLSGSAEPGLYNLQVSVTPALPLVTETSSSNDGTLSTGELRQSIGITALSPFGRGDSLNVSYQFSEGASMWSSRFDIPINAWGGKVGFSWLRASDTIIQPPFDLLQVGSTQTTYELFVRQPLKRRISPHFRQELVVGLSLAHTDIQSHILGINFPLAPGENENGYAQATVLSLDQTYVNATPAQSIGIASSLKLGLPIAATINPQPPDGEFVLWQGQVSWHRLLSQRVSFGTDAVLQWSDRPVFTFLQVNLTGANAVRGYPQNIIVNSNAYYQRTGFTITAYKGNIGELQVTPFFDFGVPWAVQAQLFAPSSPNVLASTGIGLRYRYRRYLELGLSWGFPLYSLNPRGSSLQENGVSFTVRSQFP